MALVSRSPLAETASYWAQGGIAAALAEDDSPQLHYEDTVNAARDSARPSAVTVLCEESPGRVRDPERLGVHFDADRSGNLSLGLEGGHSRRRSRARYGNHFPESPDHARPVGARGRARADRGARPASVGAVAARRRRCVGLLAGQPRRRLRADRRARHDPGDRGMAALWQRTTNRGLTGGGHSLARGGRPWPTWSSSNSARHLQATATATAS